MFWTSCFTSAGATSAHVHGTKTTREKEPRQPETDTQTLHHSSCTHAGSCVHEHRAPRAGQGSGKEGERYEGAGAQTATPPQYCFQQSPNFLTKIRDPVRITLPFPSPAFTYVLLRVSG